MKKSKVKRRTKASGGTRSESCGKCEIAAKGIAQAGSDMKVPVDFVEARKNIATLVRMSVNEIVVRFIELAKDGEVGPAKYLFEVCGLYPVTAETSAKPESSLAYTLLKRLGLPTDPIVCEDDAPAAGLSCGTTAMKGADEVSGKSANQRYSEQK
ncbi:MAG: hypothetical protein WBM24_05830 [Candidatus Sulfotelmatobacter sp.]